MKTLLKSILSNAYRWRNVVFGNKIFVQSFTIMSFDGGKVFFPMRTDDET